MQTIALKFCNRVFYESFVEDLNRRGHQWIKPWRAVWQCRDGVAGEVISEKEKHFKTESQAITCAWNWIHKGRIDVPRKCHVDEIE